MADAATAAPPAAPPGAAPPRRLAEPVAPPQDELTLASLGAQVTALHNVVGTLTATVAAFVKGNNPAPPPPRPAGAPRLEDAVDVDESPLDPSTVTAAQPPAAAPARADYASAAAAPRASSPASWPAESDGDGSDNGEPTGVPIFVSNRDNPWAPRGASREEYGPGGSCNLFRALDRSLDATHHVAKQRLSPGGLAELDNHKDVLFYAEPIVHWMRAGLFRAYRSGDPDVLRVVLESSLTSLDAIVAAIALRAGALEYVALADSDKAVAVGKALRVQVQAILSKKEHLGGAPLNALIAELEEKFLASELNQRAKAGGAAAAKDDGDGWELVQTAKAKAAAAAKPAAKPAANKKPAAAAKAATGRAVTFADEAKGGR